MPTDNIATLTDRFAGLRVAVIGEAMLDVYLEAQPGRFCQEAPVPLLKLSGRHNLPGGAANTAVNLRSLGAQVELLSVIGADAEADLLADALHSRSVNTIHLHRSRLRRTQTKHRLYASDQMVLRFDQGSTEAIDEATEEALLVRLAEVYAHSDALLVSDYRYGILTPRIIRALGDLQTRWSKVLVIDSRRLRLFHEVGATAVKPNYAEAVELLGGGALDGFRARADAISHHRDEILELTGASFAAVTLDGEGAVLLERGRPPYRTFAAPSRRVCVAGAGDTYAAALALSLAAGATGQQAADLAAAAADVVVAKDGTASCLLAELREHLSSGGKFFADRERLAARLDFYRQQGKRIVFTNGCFDILHRGHITYLHRAKMLGDILVVGVNDDASIRRLKGPTRPINALEDRVHVLAALGCVDHLVAFGEDTPCNLIRVVRPDVFVKGGDYTRARLPEAPLVEELGGTVQILPFLSDRSTTGLIERIQGAAPQISPLSPASGERGRG